MRVFKWLSIRSLLGLLSVLWLFSSSPVSAADFYYSKRSSSFAFSTPSEVCPYYGMYYNAGVGAHGACYYSPDFTGSGQYVDQKSCPATLLVESHHPANPSINAVCHPPASACPDAGTAGGLTVSVFQHSLVPEFYSVDGCKFVVTEYSCGEPDADSVMTCSAQGEFTGDEVAPGDPNYADPEETTGEPPKKCYYSDGRYMGTVSANASCPSRVNCYSGDGILTATAESPSQCPSGTSTENSPDAPDPEPTDPADPTDPGTGSGDGGDDGSGTGDDGSTGDGSTGDGSGGDGTEGDGTGTEPDGVTGGLTCDVKPTCNGDPVQCYIAESNWRQECGKNELVENGACSEGEFRCVGSPIDCFIAKTKRQQYCEARDLDAAQQAVQDAITAGVLESAETDEYGQLLSLDAGEINIEDHFNVSSMWSDTGGAGSCPQPISISVLGASIDVDFKPLCDLAGYIRAFVIFMATWISFSMLTQTLIGTRWW